MPCRKIKISISPWGGTFQFSARGERYLYLKKVYPRVNFTSPTCNMPQKTYLYQKQPSRSVPRKTCSENMQQIYRRTPIPKCDFNKVALQRCWNHTSTWRSPVNLLHIFRAAFLKNTSAPLFLVYIRLNLTCFVHTWNKRFFSTELHCCLYELSLLSIFVVINHIMLLKQTYLIFVHF